jgi:hypothetical protein
MKDKAKHQVATMSPLVMNGVLAVDPQRCPTLHRALTRMLERGHTQGDWAQVVKLRAKGDLDAAGRIARRAMGIAPEPMDENTKAKLRSYANEHKDEIKQKRKQEREVRLRTIALLTTGKKGR